MSYTATVHMAPDTVRGLLAAAFEGGSNYWIETIRPGGGQIPPTVGKWHWSQILPTTGGSVAITVREDDADATERLLDDEAIRRGVALFVQHPQYGAVLSDSDDATTGDVFLQLAIFGEVIFG